MSYGEATDAARRAAAAPAASSAPMRPRYGEMAPTEAEEAAARCRGIRRPRLRRRRHGAVVGTLTRFADYQSTGFSGV